MLASISKLINKTEYINKLNTKFHIAVENNDIVKVRKYLEKGAQIEYENDDGVTALRMAFDLEYSDLFSILLKQYKADINVIDKNDTSLLLLICLRNDSTFLKLLIKNGVDVNRTMANGITPLNLCVLKCYVKSMQELLSFECIQVNVQENISKRTPLHYACMKSNGTIVKLLCQRDGIKLNTQDVNGYTALHYACSNRENFKIVLLLIKRGCNLNLKDITGKTALDLACEYKALSIVKLLVAQRKIIKNLSNPDTNKYLLDNNVLFTHL